MKMKHSVSSLLYRGASFFGEIYRGMLYMGTNDQIMQERKLIFKRFQRSSQVSFSLIHPDLGCWYIIWKVNTTNGGLNLKNTFCALCFWGWRFHLKLAFFSKKILVVNCSLMSLLQGSFRFIYLWGKFMEKWVKAVHSELAQTQAPSELWIK